MNQVQMIALLDTLSVPSVYDHALEGQALPFIAIHTEQPDNFAADNLVYCEKWNFRIDLYTVKKDLTLEAAIKKLLNDNGIAWVKTEQYIDSEQVWEVEFEFQVLGNEAIPVPPEPTPTPDPPTPDEGGGDDEEDP